MLALRTHRIPSLLRLTNAARLAAMRPPTPIEVADPNTLRTPRLLLRPMVWTDRAEFRRVIGMSREHLAVHCPLHRDGESDDALFDRLLEQSARGLELRRAWRAAFFSIGPASDARLLGLINLNDITRGLENVAEANWWTSADAIGHGYATEALRAALDHAFGDLPRGLGLHRVTALIAPDNVASRRVAVKAGMRCPGARAAAASERELMLGGRRVPHRQFEIFAPLTGPRRTASRRPSPSLRAGLASILSAEAAFRLNVR